MMKTKLKPLAIVIGAIVSYQPIGYAQTAVTTREPLWSIDVPRYAQTIPLDNKLLISAQTDRGKPDKLRSIDPATGKLQWTSQASIGDIVGVENGTIYAQDFGSTPLVDAPKKLVTIDSNTGKTKSRLNLDNSTFVRAVGVHRGAFIINSYVKRGYKVEGYAISARTANKTLWTFKTPKDSLPIDNKISVAENGTIFIPLLVNSSTDRRGYELTALDAKTGKVMWKWKTAAEPETLVVENRVYASIYSEDRAGEKAGWVKAFDLQSGRELWTHQMLGGMALLANDREVFIADRAAKSKSRLVVVDNRTGTKLRQLDLPLDYPQGIGGSILGNNIIYTSDLKIENVVPGFYGSADNHSWVNAFDLSDGKLLWRTPTLRHSQIRSLKIKGNRLFLTSQGLKNNVKSTVQLFPDR